MKTELRSGMETLNPNKPGSYIPTSGMKKIQGLSDSAFTSILSSSILFSKFIHFTTGSNTWISQRITILSCIWKNYRPKFQFLTPKLVPCLLSRHLAAPCVTFSKNISFRAYVQRTYLYHPQFSWPHPSEFARHWRGLDNLLPPGGTEPFIYQILVDHFNLDKTKLIADAYLNLLTPFTDNIVALHEKFGHTHHLALSIGRPWCNLWR